MLFTEQERQIYTCPFTARKYDPLAVKRAILIAAGKSGRFGELVKKVKDGAEDKDEAQGELIAIGRKALSLEPINPVSGLGVLDTIVWDALTAFTGWLRGKEKRAATIPDSPPCAGCP